jgi:hypothetical protein
MRARGGWWMVCRRCGDEVDAPGDRLGPGPGPGWTHHEWRLRAASASAAAAAAAAARAAARRPGRKRGKLAAELDRLELRLLGPSEVEPGERLEGAGRAPAPILTYCAGCLTELGRGVQNRRLVADILCIRRGEMPGGGGGGGPGRDGSLSPPAAAARRRSPDGRPLV